MEGSGAPAQAHNRHENEAMELEGVSVSFAKNGYTVRCSYEGGEMGYDSEEHVFTDKAEVLKFLEEKL